MRAAVRYRFGAPSEVVEIREVEKPIPTEDEVLVRVHAASLNFGDWYAVVGRPWVGRPSMGLRAPKSERLGTDYAGVVEAVGANVTDFRPGDEVFGGRSGALAEYVAARADRSIVPKPANVSFEEAAAVPVAALTALQALRDHGKVQAGQKVLINGASGGVGTYAVQLAKSFGAEVTAVCSTRNVDQAGTLGADHVVDYTQQDFTRTGELHDLMLDIAGSRPFLEFRRVLKPEATVVAVGAPMSARGLGPLKHIIGARLTSLGRSQRVVNFVAKITKEDLAFMSDLLADGKVKSVIDRRFELAQVPDALRYLGEGHARGKIVITV